MAVMQTIGKRYWVRANAVVAAESETRTHNFTTPFGRADARACELPRRGEIAAALFPAIAVVVALASRIRPALVLSDRTLNPSPQRVVG